MRTLFGSSVINAACFALLSLVGLQAWSLASGDSGKGTGENVGSVGQAVNAGDDITAAFNTFQAAVTTFGLDSPYNIGYGAHPGLNTESLTGATGFPAKGKAT